MSQSEYDIAEWLLNNKEGLIDKIKKAHNPNYNLLPVVLFDIYLDNYVRHVLNIIKYDLQSAFNLDPESLENITKEYVVNILGKEILSP